MQWWYYRGQVTTPIDIPGKGPTVIRPREKFQAPFAAVAHLKRLGRVVPCKPPKEVLRQSSVTKSEPESEKKLEERAVQPASVVASMAEPKAEVVDKEKVEATVKVVAEENPKAWELLEKESPKEEEKAKRSKRDKS
jgi:hypothetical protein